MSITSDEPPVAAGPDPSDPRFAFRGPAELRPFNELLVITAADVHVARRLAALGQDGHPDVLLACALTIRGLRLGHVCIDLANVACTATTDSDRVVDLSHLPWPDPASWPDRMAASALVADGDDDPVGRPLRLVGSRLYLDRYWLQECQVADDLTKRSLLPVADVDGQVLRHGLARLWPEAEPDGPDLQRLAAAAAVLQGFTVVAGGPGTGKTTTVARILALLSEQLGAPRSADREPGAARADAVPPLRAALAAPTGKAAARLEEAVHEEARQMHVADELRTQLLDLHAVTLHRLLGTRPGSHTRFRHDGTNHLPFDVVIVDEASMISLSLMAKLVDAVRPAARLILVGDPEQLASVEAGAVLGDVVGPASLGLQIQQEAQERLGQATGQPVEATVPPGDTRIGDGIIVLRRVHRYGGAIASLAESIQRGDADAAMDLLRLGDGNVRWIAEDNTTFAPTSAALDPIRDQIVTASRALVDAARAGDGLEALASLTAVRVLCGHRRGPAGVGTWNEHIEQWLSTAIDGYGQSGPWYLGRPVLVTQNDYELQLFNGDNGLVIRAEDGSPTVAFELRGELLTVNPAQLAHIQTLHAMTVHKSQGSQFAAVIVVLPEPSSRVLTRELLYTAVTRAQQHLTVIGTEQSLRTAVGRPIARATGLRQRLWG